MRLGDSASKISLERGLNLQELPHDRGPARRQAAGPDDAGRDRRRGGGAVPGGTASGPAWRRCWSATTRPARVYVRNKQKACEKVGIDSWLHQLPGDDHAGRAARPWSPGSTPTRRSTASWCSCRCRRRSTRRRSSTPYRRSRTWTASARRASACSPPAGRASWPARRYGVQQLLLRNGIPSAGQHVVIVGRSNIVGKPLALILMQKAAGADATVTRLPQPQPRPAGADAPGRHGGRGHRPGALPQGRHGPAGRGGRRRGHEPAAGRQPGPATWTSRRCAQVASAITPVPGGVGPMTITMLLHNTLRAAQLQA